MNQTPDPGFDPRISDWLEDDPDHAPSSVLQTILAAYPSIAQRRRWRLVWRFPTMNRLALIAAPVVIVAILVAVAVMGLPRAVVGPGSSASPDSSSAPSPEATAVGGQIGTPTPAAPSPTTRSRDYASRSGWILLEHFGANAPDGSGPMDAPDGRSLWLIRPDGGELHELAPGMPIDGKTNPAWSRDGTHIAFETVHPRRLVYETDVAGTAPVLIGQSCSGLLDDPYPCIEGSPAYSPDGNNLATVVNNLSGLAPPEVPIEVIYLRMRYENCTPPRTFCGFHLGYSLDLTQVETSTASIEGLSWSPDGSQIAYYRVAKDVDGKPLGSSEIWIVNADGTDPHKVPLPADLAAGDPDWSPDGSLLVFSSEPIHDWNDVGVPDHPDVYTVRPDGSDLQRLTNDQGSGSPTWTSDGMILFYSQREMWLMDADGSNAAPVYPNGPTLWGEDTGWSYYGYWQPIP